MKKKIIITAAVILAVCMLYLGTFHGECISHIYDNGTTHYHSKQYGFGRLMWERQWSDPADAPTTKSFHYGICTYWRGFGFLHKRMVAYD